ncbi:MAG TPA: hypothetical protein VFJ96_12050 [Gemmatimonadaceae bacterium]|nr:hypothetical protein [Gemmatimonadaceae bacterium]
MRRILAGVATVAIVAGACARPAQVTSGGEVAPQTPVNANMVPVGTTLQAKLNSTLGTQQSRVGDQFTATVTQAVTAQNGETVVPEGAVVHGEVTGLHASQNAGDQAAIKLNFDSLEINGHNYPFNAKITATNLKTQGQDKNETLKNAGVGAVAGAALGAILGGGSLSKTVLGGVLGAAAGTAVSLGMGDVQAVLPAGSELTLQSTQEVALNR